MFNRRGFFRFLLAGPASLATAAGLWKPGLPRPRPGPNVFVGQFTVSDKIAEMAQSSSVAFEAHTRRILTEQFGQPMIEALRMEDELLQAWEEAEDEEENETENGVREVDEGGDPTSEVLGA